MTEITIKTDKPPTVDELKANIANSLKEIEATPKVDPEEAEVTPVIPPKEEVVVEPTPEKPKEEVKEPVKEEVVEPAKPNEPNYEKKFSDSTREAVNLKAREARIAEAIDEGQKLPVPTDEEMKKEYPDWELMDDMTKKLAIKTALAEKRSALLSGVVEESRDFQKWDTTVDTYIEDPKTLLAFPDLEGKTEEFKLYAANKQRRGSNLETLVGSFLYDFEKSKVKHTGSMFPTGGQATTEKPKVSTKLTVEQGIALRETNYKQYKEELIKGNIESAI